MFKELDKYKINDHFFFEDSDSLGKVCNAPKTESGVYVIYALSKGKVELLYIGSAGKVQRDGHLNNSSGGLYSQIVDCKQFGNSRKISWPVKMFEEQIEALDIYWFVTFNQDVKDIPAFVEGVIIQRYFEIHGALPRWNEEF